MVYDALISIHLHSI